MAQIPSSLRALEESPDPYDLGQSRQATKTSRQLTHQDFVTTRSQIPPPPNRTVLSILEELEGSVRDLNGFLIRLEAAVFGPSPENSGTESAHPPNRNLDSSLVRLENLLEQAKLTAGRIETFLVD